MAVEVERTGNDLRVRVQDDGVGFDITAAPPDGHLGLRVLRDTVTDLGGTVELQSSVGCGSRLEARLPVG